MSKRTINRMLFLVLVIGLGYGGLNLAGAAPPASNTVTVANTATNPVPVNVTNTSVPVSGAVTIGNTPSVKIDPTGNTVQLASGSSVGISGTPSVRVDPSGNTVNVGNTPSVKLDPTGNTVQLAGTPTVQLSPSTVVTTSAADNPAFQPVHDELGGSIADGNPGPTGVQPYIVPAKEELVIEQVSFDFRLPTGEDIPAVILRSIDISAGDAFNNYVSPQHEAPVNATLTDISGSELTRVYVGPGQEVGCVFGRYPTTGAASAACSFNGYLVNLP